MRKRFAPPLRALRFQEFGAVRKRRKLARFLSRSPSASVVRISSWKLASKKFSPAIHPDPPPPSRGSAIFQAPPLPRSHAGGDSRGFVLDFVLDSATLASFLPRSSGTIHATMLEHSSKCASGTGGRLNTGTVEQPRKYDRLSDLAREKQPGDFFGMGIARQGGCHVVGSKLWMR